MSDNEKYSDIPRPNPDRHTPPGVHGNKSYGLARMEIQLKRGQPFDEAERQIVRTAIANWGIDEADLQGIEGDFIWMTAREFAFDVVLEGAKNKARKAGDLESYLMIEARYGSRRASLKRDMLKIRDWLEERRANVLDYEGVAASEDD